MMETLEHSLVQGTPGDPVFWAGEETNGPANEIGSCPSRLLCVDRLISMWTHAMPDPVLTGQSGQSIVGECVSTNEYNGPSPLCGHHSPTARGKTEWIHPETILAF